MLLSPAAEYNLSVDVTKYTMPHFQALHIILSDRCQPAALQSGHSAVSVL